MAGMIFPEIPSGAGDPYRYDAAELNVFAHNHLVFIGPIFPRCDMDPSPSASLRVGISE